MRAAARRRSVGRKPSAATTASARTAWPSGWASTSMTWRAHSRTSARRRGDPPATPASASPLTWPANWGREAGKVEAALERLLQEARGRLRSSPRRLHEGAGREARHLRRARPEGLPGSPCRRASRWAPWTASRPSRRSRRTALAVTPRSLLLSPRRFGQAALHTQSDERLLDLAGAGSEAALEAMVSLRFRAARTASHRSAASTGIATRARATSIGCGPRYGSRAAGWYA